MTLGEGIFYSTLVICWTVLFITLAVYVLIEKSKRGLEKIMNAILSAIKKGET